MKRRYIRWVPSPRTLAHITRWHVRLFRLTRGRVGGHLDGMDILLLTTRGRKTGRARTVPLPYFHDGHSYLVVASNGGRPQNPAWYHNLRATPAVTAQIGRRHLPLHATVLSGEDRERAWQHIVQTQPRYADYQRKTTRPIPLIALHLA